MNEIESPVNESCSSNPIFLKENRFQKDQITFLPLKLTPNFKNALCLTAYFKSVETDWKEITTYIMLISDQNYTFG